MNKKNISRWIFLAINVCITYNIYGQQIIFENYTVADGLSGNTVQAISQDDQGYMWFGTKGGLNRFDGYQFKSYRHEENVPYSLGNDWVNVIFNYNADSIWIGTEKGIYILNLPHETFELFKPIGKRAIFDIKRDRHGTIWIATGGGVFKYNPEKKTIKHFTHKPKDTNSLSVNFVRKLAVDNSGNIWMGTAWEGLDVYHPKTKIFKHYKATGEEGSLSSNFITALYKDMKGNIWIGTEKGGLNCWEQKTNTFKVFRHGDSNSISDDIIHNISQFSPDKLYIGTEKGMDIFNIHSEKFTNYKYKANDPYSLSDNAVYTIYSDHSGGVWIGTYFGGINYFHPEHGNFELYYPTGTSNSLSGKAVSAMLQDDSAHIWIETEDGGLNYYNIKTKTFQHYPFRARQEKLSYHNIHTLIKDHQGNIWIGTFTGGINVYHPKTGKIKVYKLGSNEGISSYSNMIYDIYQDKNNTIWVGTVGGLFRYNPKKETFSKIKRGSLKECWVYTIYEDDEGALWLGTYNRGLYKKDVQTGNWHHYNIHSNQDSLRSEKIICIQKEDNQRLWLGTDGGGLYSFDKKSGKSTSLKGQYGLQAKIFYGILKDNNGHFWMSTDNGLFDFDPVQKTSRHFTQWDHLQGKQFNYKSYLKTTDGRFYFGGVNGLNAFFPDSIRQFKSGTKIIFTDFQLFNKTVPINSEKGPLKKNITYTDRLTLSHNQSMFSIEYAALNYIAPLKTHYAYKMKGYDGDWNYVDNQRKATYTNLPAGEYIFMVKATDNNGNWDTQPAIIKLTIRPPFYQTTLAYIFYIVIILGSIWFFRKTEIKRMRKREQIRQEREQNKKEHTFYKQKIDFFTSMAHEIRTPLSLIIAPLEKLIRTGKWEPEVKEQLTIMDKNSNRLLSLTNQLLDFRRMESNLYNIHYEKVEIVSLVHSLFSRFSSISYQKGIKFSISAKISSLEVDADPEALNKILSNLLINAFKFTRSYVNILIDEPFTKENRSFFSVSIEDDGIGIPKEDIQNIFKKFYQVSSDGNEYNNLGGNGIGLALAKTLTELHQGNLSVKSEPKVKTIFTINIPFIPVEEISETEEATAINHTEQKGNKEEKKTILVIEDDPSLLRFVSKSIQEEGFKSVKAKNGKEALALFDKADIDLVISDIMMPEIDGLQFCKEIKENMNFSHIPIILLTARANMEVEIEGIESGADAYITKPFKWKHLSAVIHNLLNSRDKLKQKFSQLPFTGAGSLVTNSGDRKFVTRVTDIIHERIDDPQFSVEELSDEMAMSRSNLHKKLKAISGYAPNEFIRIIRLKYAAKLLLQNEYNISEIGYMSGFNSPSYFSKCFFQQFKMTPREFIDKQKDSKPI